MVTMFETQHCTALFLFKTQTFNSFLFFQVNQDLPFVIVGNKNDLEADRVVTTDEGIKLAFDLKVPYFELSGKLVFIKTINNNTIVFRFICVLSNHHLILQKYIQCSNILFSFN